MDIISLPLILMVNFFAAQVLNQSPIGVFALQRDREGQARGFGDSHIVFAKVGELDKQLLVLVDAGRIVDDDHVLRTPLTLSNSRSDL